MRNINFGGTFFGTIMMLIAWAMVIKILFPAIFASQSFGALFITIFGIPELDRVQFAMRCPSKHDKILKSIVIYFSVNVMDVLIRCYRSVKMFGHNKGASSNIPVMVSIRVPMFENKNAPISIPDNSTLPTWVVGAKHRFGCSTHMGTITNMVRIVKVAA